MDFREIRDLCIFAAIMLGTIVNTCTIIVGTIIGTVLHNGVKEQYRRVLYDGLGLASIAIGLNAALPHMQESQYPILFIIAVALGGVAGTALDLDARFRRLIDRRAAGRKKDSKGANSLADGLITAMLLYCIGPLSMLGPVVSALKALFGI